MLKLLCLFVLTLMSVHKATTSRILAVIPSASYSHQMFFQPLWRELAIRGHDMVVVTTDPTGEILQNFKEVSIRESYPPTRIALKRLMEENTFKVLLSNEMNEFAIHIADFQLSLPQVQEIINNQTEHFDLIMIEHMYPIMFGLKHRFQCPLIGVMSLDAFPASHEAVGNPVHSLLYPLSFFHAQENLTFFERLIFVFVSNLLNYKRNANLDKMDGVVRKIFGPDSPSLVDIIADTDMLFVNANPLFSPVRPHTPATISLAGGIHLMPEKPLPKHLQEFLDSATDGAIYLSFGSNVKSNELPSELKKIILDDLSDLPYKVLWKFEDENLPGKPDNVKLIQWAPQQDILRHKNVKLFVTQAGLQSLEEALYSHVPMVAMPFLGDQKSNAAKLKSKGLGVVLDRNNLNRNYLKEAILEVMNNLTYRNSVKELAAQIQDQPMAPLERAIWWTEYVLRHKGAQHLKGPQIPLYQYYYLDIFAFLGMIFILVTYLTFVFVRFIVRFFKSVFQCSKVEKTKFKRS